MPRKRDWGKISKNLTVAGEYWLAMANIRKEKRHKHEFGADKYVCLGFDEEVCIRGRQFIGNGGN